jgi:hypothetical protein
MACSENATVARTYMYTTFVPVDTKGGLPYFSRYQLYLYREDGLAKQGEHSLGVLRQGQKLLQEAAKRSKWP